MGRRDWEWVANERRPAGILPCFRPLDVRNSRVQRGLRRNALVARRPPNGSLGTPQVRHRPGQRAQHRDDPPHRTEQTDERQREERRGVEVHAPSLRDETALMQGRELAPV